MPVEPRWIRYKEGATLVRDDRRRFDEMTLQYEPGNASRSWRQRPWMGHNAGDPSTQPDRPKLNVDNVNIRTR